MQVPFFTHHRELEAHEKELMQAVKDCVHSPLLILSEKVKSFEKAFSELIGVSHGIGVASGTDALALALKGLGIGEGDEVITVANTTVPTIAAIRMAGAIPRFVDIDPETWMMDTSAIESAITKKTKCILPVHLFGNAVDMDPVIAIAKKHHLKIVGDCAQAFGTTYNGKPVGSFGDVACFSFYPTKNLGGWGDGGMCVTNDESLAEKIRLLRVYGWTNYVADIEGVNSRLDELQAAILLQKLTYISHDIERRRAIAKAYDEGLQGSAWEIPHTTKNTQHSYHLYVVKSPEERGGMRKKLSDEGIMTAVHYPMPIHVMPAYEFLGYKKGSLPITEEIMQSNISLPFFPYLKEDEIEYVIETLKKIP